MGWGYINNIEVIFPNALYQQVRRISLLAIFKLMNSSRFYLAPRTRCQLNFLVRVSHPNQYDPREAEDIVDHLGVVVPLGDFMRS